MARREVFSPSRGIRIETSKDWSGRYYICWQPGASIFVRTRKEVIKFFGWPIKTPTGDALRVWLTDMEAADAEREAAKAPVVVNETGSGDPQPALLLTDELLATGFGPECHDVDNANTRTVI
jgi:hypothetical protein